MSFSNLVRMMVQRDTKGQPVLDKRDNAIPTWLTMAAFPFFKAEAAIMVEQVLWREVAARLVLDALGFASVANKTPEDRIKAMAEAQAFLRDDEEHAKLVFYAAGIEFDPVRREVLKIIDERDLFNEPAPEICEGSD